MRHCCLTTAIVVTRTRNNVTLCVHRLSLTRHFQGLAEKEHLPVLLGSLSFGMQRFVFGYRRFGQQIGPREILHVMLGR